MSTCSAAPAITPSKKRGHEHEGRFGDAELARQQSLPLEPRQARPEGARLHNRNAQRVEHFAGLRSVHPGAFGQGCVTTQVDQSPLRYAPGGFLAHCAQQALAPKMTAQAEDYLFAVVYSASRFRHAD
jgi:hypothetical protein